ncbi:GroES-like protein [Auriscalpium vulgare]|uniref:GroES-like protein n=1 Tax=Auriscalpium vulgare TaxID=40419 RepID=A0ACB8S6S9_9AGAM|nr:GroES-like protein [Auriscalpium vulgare]
MSASFSIEMSPTDQQALILPAKFAEYVVGPRPVPKPAPGFVLVKIESTTLNPIDNVIQKAGIFIAEFPGVPGSEAAGTVEEVGEGVTNVKKGDRVMYQGWWTAADRGTLQQYGLADAARIAKIPDTISFDEAATVPLGLATAVLGLYGKRDSLTVTGGGRTGLTVPWEPAGRGAYSGPAVVIGGASSVGHYALQLLKLSGYSPIITTASGHNEAYCKAAGATHVIDYHKVSYSELPAAVAQITTTAVSVVYDAIALDDTQKTAWQILAPRGNLVVTRPPVVGKSGEDAEDGKHLVLAFGNVHPPPNNELGGALYRALPGLLVEGVVTPTAVEVLQSGLAGIHGGLVRIGGGNVSGMKLVVHPQETA